MIFEKILCGLDIGSHEIKASAVKVKRGNRVELLGVHSAPTKGFRKSTINDLPELSESIHSILKELSKRTGVKLKDVHLGIGGSLIEPRYSKAVVPLIDKASKVVAHSDIKKINKQARLLGTKIEEDILHDFPQFYLVDDISRVLNPTGLYGRKIGVTSLLIIAKVNLIGNIAKAVHQAGYEVSDVFFSSLVSAEAALSKSMMENGCLLIDVGASTTNLLFFKDGFLRHLDIIALGGDHLTVSIARALNLTVELAEEVKKSHAAILTDEIKHSAEILVKKEDGYMSIKRKVICEAIDSEIAKLVSSIQDTIKFSHLQDKLSAGVVMVGGGALLSGFIEHVEKNINISVRLGKVNISGSVLNNASVFTAAVGLTYGRFVKSAHHILFARTPKNWMEYLSRKITDLYEEYF